MPALEEGQKFERYRIVRRLGNSLSGISYEAEDPMLHRKVALKLIHPHTTLPDAARRQFFRDMQGLSVISHPYLTATLDYGEAEGQLYIVHRYIDAGSLLGNEGRRWFQTPLQIRAAITYAYQLSQVLALIHSYGYIHGSLTLSNILVLRGPTLEGAPNFAPFLLTDVGIANFARHHGKPQNNQLPMTAAPEQLKGQALPASDQYALAVIIYLWIAGRPPFLGTTEEIEKSKFTETYPLLSSYNPEVTFKQEGIMRRAMSVYPEDRYPSVQVFMETFKASLPQVMPIKVAVESATILPIVVEKEKNSIPPVTPTITQQEPAQTEPAPQPQVVPDVPQPGPQEPAPIPEPFPAPEEPLTQPEPAPQPEVITPAPDIAQPIPDPTPFPQEPPTIFPPAQQQEAASHTYLTPLYSEAANTPQRLTQFTIHFDDTKAPVIMTFDQPEITLGRAGSSDILLDLDDATSRHHALIRREGEFYLIYDKRSTHGVVVNGEKLPCEIGYPLEDGDKIEIGAYTLTFGLQSTREAQPLSSKGVRL